MNKPAHAVLAWHREEVMCMVETGETVTETQFDY